MEILLREPLLHEGEYIVFRVRHHISGLLGYLALSSLLISFWAAILATLPGSRRGIPLVVMISIFIVITIFPAIKFIKWLNIRLTLTNRRLIYTSGFLRKHTTEILLGSISNVGVYQSVFQRMIRSGFLVVETGSDKERTHEFGNMPLPDTLKEMIVAEASRLREELPERAVDAIAREVSRSMKSEQPTREITVIPPERPPIYTEIVDQIERLDSLRKSGAITLEEFERAKTALLKRMEESKND